MTELVAQPNLLIEALAYLGRRANGNTWEHTEERLRERRIPASAVFTHALGLLKKLAAQLDRLEAVKQADLTLFLNLEGSAHNTVGTGSPAFLLLYATLEDYHGDTSAYLREVCALPPEKVAYHMALALDLADDYPRQALSDSEFLELVLTSALPDSSKITILNTYRSYAVLIAQVAPPLEAVITALSQEKGTLSVLSEVLTEKVQTEGCAQYLARTSRLTLSEDQDYRLRPFLFGMDTCLTSDESAGVVQVYCGILRDELLTMLSGQTPVQEAVYDAYKLLGDRTRFDILCYLRGRSAYGQELSAHFGLSRNTIHHHMNKLLSYGLVRCTTAGNRVYYSLDAQAISLLLDRQKDLFSDET